MRPIQIGDPVMIKDENGVERHALVTQQWGTGEYDESQPVHLSINVVFLAGDPSKTDCYGRQTEHLSSVCHRSVAGTTPGRFWWQP